MAIPLSAGARRRRSVGRLAVGSGVRELGIFAAAYVVYFGVRAITQGDAPRAISNAVDLIRFERAVGVAWEGPVQHAVLRSGVLLDVANAVYMYGHWPVIIGAGTLLFRYRRDDYFRLRDACLLSGLVGLVVFSLFPVAPPRLTDLPMVDTVTREAAGYRQIVPATLVNQYAAMPSFHAGWNLLAGIVVFSATRHVVLRALAVLGPAAMMLAVVATANHYVVDVVAGVVIVVACLIVRDAVNARQRVQPTIGVDERQGHAGDRHRPHSGPVPHRASRRQRSHAAGSRPIPRHPAR